MKYLGKKVIPQFEQDEDPRLDTFENACREKVLVTIETDEFTALCPITNQPDFARIHIQYIPNASLIESKSLKLYFMSFRNVGMFHEFIIDKIATDFEEAVKPHYVQVKGVFNSRGGLSIAAQSFRGKRDLYLQLVS